MILLNNNLQLESENDVLQGVVIYEVIRIIQKKPLFLKEHLQRLHNSASMCLPHQPSNSMIAEGIQKIIDTNSIAFGNIEIQLNDHQYFLVKVIPHSYPTESMYQQGVCLGLLRAERIHPNAKEKNQSLRDRANALMKENHNFEVLLVDDHELITEGSRSNVFFVKDNQVITSPTKNILQGITREKIFEICHLQNINICETEIPVKSLTTFDAVFMTGTSPAVLPVQKIENITYSPKNILTEKLKVAYNQLVETDLNQFDWIF